MKTYCLEIVGDPGEEFVMGKFVKGWGEGGLDNSVQITGYFLMKEELDTFCRTLGSGKG